MEFIGYSLNHSASLIKNNILTKGRLILSETVHYKGVLKEVERYPDENLSYQCKRLLDNRELPSYYDSYEEFLRDELYKEYIIHDDIVYKYEKEELDPESDIFEATRNINGDIEFEVLYYNGGCSFEEAIEEAMRNIS
jgi:hypothetical protein